MRVREIASNFSFCSSHSHYKFFFLSISLVFFRFRSPLLSVCFEILKLYLCRCWKLTMGWWFFLLYQLNIELSVWVRVCVRGGWWSIWCVIQRNIRSHLIWSIQTANRFLYKLCWLLYFFIGLTHCCFYCVCIDVSNRFNLANACKLFTFEWDCSNRRFETVFKAMQNKTMKSIKSRKLIGIIFFESWPLNIPL